MKSVQDNDLSILQNEQVLQKNYHDTYVYVLPKDPQSAYVIYTIAHKTKDFLRFKYGEDFFDLNYLIMNVYQVDGRGEFNGFNYNYKFIGSLIKNFKYGFFNVI